MHAPRRLLLIDADGLGLGRLASSAAQLFMGKDNALYIRSFDIGDYVIVLNARRIVISGTDVLIHR
jgi:large subunit ribosomal protein L13